MASGYRRSKPRERYKTNPAVFKPGMNEGIYNLSTDPTTFDFITWSVIAKTSGVDHAHFVVDEGIRTDKYDEVTAWKRFGNILIPGTKLAGLTFTVGSKREGKRFGWHYGQVERVSRETPIQKLKPTVKLNIKDTVTITLRESIRNSWRDANKENWLSFAEELKSEGLNVIILNDCELNPIDLQYRMALYSESLMNYGSSNGPLVLCHLSEAPYLTLNMTPPNPNGQGYNLIEHMKKGGFPKGSQFSFKTDKQLLVYEKDTLENIRKFHKQIFNIQ